MIQGTFEAIAYVFYVHLGIADSLYTYNAF